MVIVRGGGDTYSLGSGRTVAPDELPQWFLDAEAAQRDEPRPADSYCQAEKAAAQKCIERLGMWHADCVDLTEKFHQCQGRALSAVRPPPPPRAAAGGAEA